MTRLHVVQNNPVKPFMRYLTKDEVAGLLVSVVPAPCRHSTASDAK